MKIPSNSQIISIAFITLIKVFWKQMIQLIVTRIISNFNCIGFNEHDQNYDGETNSLWSCCWFY